MTDTTVEPFDEVHRLVREAIDNAGADYHAGQLAVALRERIRDEYPGLFDDWTAADKLRDP